MAHERGRGNNPHIVVGDAASHRKAGAVLNLIENSVFWHTLARYVVYYFFLFKCNPLYVVELFHIPQPLVLAVNFTQAAHCQLDEVLIMFGFLILTYTEMLKGVSGEDEVMVTAIMNSLEKR